MGRECKKSHRQTTIRQRACELVIAHGYDGFTMNDLAAAVGVSRRTLFNAFPDKASAVLGAKADILARLEAHPFVRGGPTGHLADDLVSLLEVALSSLGSDDRVGHTQRLFVQAVAVDLKVLQLATARGNELTDVTMGLLCQRTGWTPTDLRTRTLVAYLSSLVNLTLHELATRPGPHSIVALLHEVLHAHREVAPLLIPTTPPST